MARVEPFDEYVREYEEWFERNHYAYLSELQAVKTQLPGNGRSVEIGVGTGRFAAPLGIDVGVEPSRRMREIARDRGIKVIDGIGERLPFDDAEFDIALLVTTICFLDDVTAALAETYRVLRSGGCIILGFIDKGSPLGRVYRKHAKESPFYRVATFYSAAEVSQYLTQAGFRDLTFVQTIFQDLSNMTEIEPVRPGHGEGSFIVVKGLK